MLAERDWRIVHAHHKKYQENVKATVLCKQAIAARIRRKVKETPLSPWATRRSPIDAERYVRQMMEGVSE
jgi:hypothetical protein